MIAKLVKRIRAARGYLTLPFAAKAERWADRRPPSRPDPGIESAINASLDWILLAQANTRSGDDGIARSYSLIKGWNSSYPNATGHTIPVLLESREHSRRPDDEAAAKRMLDWLVPMQLQSGGYPGGLAGSDPGPPVSFNTGSILLGLAAGAKAFGEPYLDSMRKTADWLRDDQDDDGCWRRHPSADTRTTENVYDTHIGWSLLEAHRVDPDRGYAEAALRNASWALQYQRTNGWLDNCCLSNPEIPLTHTLGFAFRGIVEAFRFSENDQFMNASKKLADGLLQALDFESGYLPGRVDSSWNGAVDWACPTATAQVSICWLLLFERLGDRHYLEAAVAANRFLRKAIKVNGDPNVRGGCKGSFPVHGGYSPYNYISPRFCIEANDLELKIAGNRSR